jgi:MFS transporter
VLGIGPGYAFAIDAATFLVSAAFLVRMHPRERGAATERTTVLAELREGWSEVRRQRWIFTIVAVFSFGLLMSFGPMQTLGPTISIEHYDTRAVYGIVAAVAGAGTIAGALIGFRWRPRYPMRAGMLLALLFPLANGLFALGVPVPVIVLFALLDGIGIALFGIWWETALAERVPAHMLSRVTAYDWMGSLALLPIGYLLAGPIGERYGASEVLAAGSALALAAILSSFLVREVRTLERL